MPAPKYPVMKTLEGWNVVEKTLTFDGGTTNAIGDYDGTGDPATIFTVTGQVTMKLLAVCTTLLAGATATVEVGTTKSTAGLIALTTATDIDADEIWHDASPDAGVEAESVLVEKVVHDNVILNTKTANVTSGVIKFIALWKPLSHDGNVVAA